MSITIPSSPERARLWTVSTEANGSDRAEPAAAPARRSFQPVAPFRLRIEELGGRPAARWLATIGPVRSTFCRRWAGRHASTQLAKRCPLFGEEFGGGRSYGDGRSSKRKNQCSSAEKERMRVQGFVLRLHPLSGSSRPESCGHCNRSAFPKDCPMARLMKYCPNYQCVAYGRVVYSQATRCAFCRWDLRPPRMRSESSAEEKSPTLAPAEPAITTSPAEAPRAQHRRPAQSLPRTA